MLLKKAIEFLYCLQFKKKLKFVFLFVILVFFSFSGLKIVYSVKSGTNNEIKQYNNQVYEKLKELQGSKLPTARDEKEAQIVYLLAQRKSLLLEKIKDNPAVLKDNALPKEIYAGLPDSAKNLVEKETKINGKLMILVADRPSGREEDYYEIKDEDQNKTFNLNFIESPHDLKSNSKVSVNGLLLEKELVLDSSNNPNIIVLETPPVASLISGTRNVLVIRQSFLDSSNPFSAAAMSAEVFTDADSSKNYYIENSYNQLTLAGDVVGPYTIPYNKSGQCLYNDWAEASLDAAIADGVNVNNYDHAAFVFADVPACAWAGLGHVDGPYTWYNGYNESTTYSHELGHNFGAYHAAMKLCGTVTIDDYANCTHYEYGDNWDVMGYSWTTTAAHFNAPHKIQMGWIPTERVQNITSSGTYTIYPVETTTSNIQALKIWKPNTDDYYYLEYRQAVGSDSWFATGITSGVVAHIWKDGVDPTTHLLDLTPADHTGSNFSLPDGSSFTDNVNGITITGVSHNATSVTVNVDIPDLSDIDHIDLTPSAPQTINAGTQLQFSAKAMDIGNHWITGITTYTWTGTDSNGLFTNSNAGDHNVRATYGGVNSPIVVVTVVMGNVYSIVLSPDTNQTITAGQTIQFTASARDYYNNVVPDIIFTWEGTNSSGLFNNTSAGAHSVRARYAAKSSNPVQITVNAGPVDHIYIDPLGNQTITAGQTIQFTPQSQDQYNNVISIPIGNYTWQNTN
ncbi:hypothetical protein A2Y26_02450 [candidate division CPR2 bacterium GWD2_39_7]|nr:MAG: Peptidase M11 gametolysin [candidate division CPR2 bacterium GW2011_GWD2_39_7]OGB72365.1 MAG: hypothetical protein A2Y26_02450 [candidate division CPR2 bacterium GWD2_39_7]